MEDKAQQLAEIEGWDNPYDLLDAVGFDSLQPSICMNEGCDYSTDYEPDSSDGWCDICQTNTVSSISILLGVI